MDRKSPLFGEMVDGSPIADGLMYTDAYNQDVYSPTPIRQLSELKSVSSSPKENHSHPSTTKAHDSTHPQTLFDQNGHPVPPNGKQPHLQTTQSPPQTQGHVLRQVRHHLAPNENQHNVKNAQTRLPRVLPDPHVAPIRESLHGEVRRNLETDLTESPESPGLEEIHLISLLDEPPPEDFNCMPALQPGTKGGLSSRKAGVQSTRGAAPVKQGRAAPPPSEDGRSEKSEKGPKKGRGRGRGKKKNKTATESFERQAEALGLTKKPTPRKAEEKKPINGQADVAEEEIDRDDEWKFYREINEQYELKRAQNTIFTLPLPLLRRHQSLLNRATLSALPPHDAAVHNGFHQCIRTAEHLLKKVKSNDASYAAQLSRMDDAWEDREEKMKAMYEGLLRDASAECVRQSELVEKLVGEKGRGRGR